eukprot:INCI17460.1.p1 GENE.INCI17460.1~~INCI17460.1.p1  ORF type:complete len:526 (+),score=134.71 INCI17460.1:153-1730(+)
MLQDENVRPGGQQPRSRSTAAHMSRSADTPRQLPHARQSGKTAQDTRDKRRVPFIYQLLKDKASLTTKCAELCKYVENVEAAAMKRARKREAALSDMADARFQQWKADFRAKSRISSEHQAEAIRNECIAAFKPEVQRLLDKHKAEIAMLQKEHAVEQEKMAAKIPAKAARMAKKQVTHLQRDLAHVSATKIASIRSQWLDDRRRHEAAEARWKVECETREQALIAKHQREVDRLKAQTDAEKEERTKEHTAAEAVRQRQESIRSELQEQQAELANEMYLRDQREKIHKQIHDTLRSELDQKLLETKSKFEQEAKDRATQHKLEMDALRSQLRHQEAQEVQELEERWNQESLHLRRQLSQAELRTKHLQQELDQARENCQRLTRDRLALREEVHSLTESVQRYKAEHLQDKLNLKELDHEFQIELSNARISSDTAMQRKIEQLLIAHARKLDVVQEEKHLLEQEHAAELRSLQESISATLGKQREQRKTLLMENEYLRSTVKRLESQLLTIAAEERDDHAHRHRD